MKTTFPVRRQETDPWAYRLFPEYVRREVLHEEQLPAFRRVMQEFYQCLKVREAMTRFCFFTGITKFPQPTIFSTLNNLTNISLPP